jgi:hypothetical protein
MFPPRDLLDASLMVPDMRPAERYPSRVVALEGALPDLIVCRLCRPL